MAINPNLLISATFGNYTSNYLQGSETASFYIHDFDTEENIANGSASTNSHNEVSEQYIRDIFYDLDFFFYVNSNMVHKIKPTNTPNTVGVVK